jgi:hypothetical protein
MALASALHAVTACMMQLSVTHVLIAVASTSQQAYFFKPLHIPAQGMHDAHSMCHHNTFSC